MSGRCLLILLDGLGDRAYIELGNRTPLAAARTPTLDRLAAAGATGLLYAGRPGLALPSENAHFAMFGYEAGEFPGRGCLEALGAGIELAGDEVALLAHLAHLTEEEGVLTLAADRPPADEETLAPLLAAVAALQAGAIHCRFERTGRHDGIVVLRGDVSSMFCDTDPLTAGVPLIDPRPLAGAPPQAAVSAAALRHYLLWCYRTLAAHPVNRSRRAAGRPELNGLVTQRPGRFSAVESFAERWGLRGLSIASGIVYHGLARFLGLDVKRVADSADPGADLAARLRLALDDRGHDFIHVHTKAPDAAAHTKDPAVKVAAIEALDRGLATVAERLLADPELLVVITADHSTPSGGPQVHSGEPVPVAWLGRGARVDRVARFDEVSVAGGALGTVQGRDLMPMVLNGLDRAKLQGLIDGPVDRPYWPGPRSPLRLDR